MPEQACKRTFGPRPAAGGSGVTHEGVELLPGWWGRQVPRVVAATAEEPEHIEYDFGICHHHLLDIAVEPRFQIIFPHAKMVELAAARPPVEVKLRLVPPDAAVAPLPDSQTTDVAAAPPEQTPVALAGETGELVPESAPAEVTDLTPPPSVEP